MVSKSVHLQFCDGLQYDMLILSSVAIFMDCQQDNIPAALRWYPYDTIALSTCKGLSISRTSLSEAITNGAVQILIEPRPTACWMPCLTLYALCHACA